MKLVAAPLIFYIDPGKMWFAIKPMEPEGLLFYEYMELSASMVDQGKFESVQSKIIKRFSKEEQVSVELIEPRDFTACCTAEDDRVPFPPRVEAFKIQAAAEKKLNEILACPFTAHPITKMLCDSLKDKGDPFDLNDLQYIDSLHEIVLEKAKVKHDESD
jgi:hypothetical protein